MKRYVPIFLVGALVSVGTFWSFQRGGQDFAVFYEAWKLVIQGRGPEIYINSPDRFLYAPGFAWIFAPLALFPKSAALAIWNLGKAWAVFALIQAFGKKLHDESRASKKPLSDDLAWTIAAGGFVLCARPLLIDFQYGQVNVYIAAACAWALLAYFSESGSRIQVALSWLFLGVVAVAKLFALPLLLLPWVYSRPGAKFVRVTRIARISSILGVLIAAVIPVLTLGFSGALSLILAWREALISKGLPFETHNQSFIALLHHYFTSSPTHVIALGWNWIVLGRSLLTIQSITELSLAWAFFFMGVLLVWIIRAPGKVDPLRWIAVAMALLFVPSYLVWKPYFVLGYPLAVLLLWQYGSTKKWLIAAGFVAMNLSGFDFVGGYWAARLEAASVFLLVHMAYLACVFWAKPESEKTPIYRC